MAVTNNPFYTPDGVRSGNDVNVTGNVSATGNITGAFILGNGAFLSGIDLIYSNANVKNYMANFGSNVISTSGTVTAGNLIGEGGNISNIIWANIVGANANVAAYLGSGNAFTINTTGTISTTGTVTAATITTGANNITLTGNTISTTNETLYLAPGGTGPFTGNVVIDGNLSVSGNVTYIDANTTTTSNLLYIAADNVEYANAAAAAGAGISVGNIANSVSIASWLYSNTANAWVSNIGISAAGNVTGSNFTTAGLVSAGGNVIGNNLVTGGVVNATGTITGANFIGNGDGITFINAANVKGGAGTTLEVGSISATGNIVVDTFISATGDITGGNIKTANAMSAGGNIDGGNINTPNVVSAVGNIIGGNINTANTVSAGGVIATGNIAGGNITTANTVSAGGGVIAVGNIDGGNINTANTVSAGGVIATGNVAGGNITTGNTISAGGNILGNNITASNSVIGSSLAYNVLTSRTSNSIATSYSIIVSTANSGTITLPAGIRATEYNWVAEATGGNTSVGMGKGFLVADATNASVSSYGYSNVGDLVFSLPVISGNSAALVFTFANTTGNYEAVLTTTQYL